MKRFRAGLPALVIGICMNVAAPAFAADTNSPSANKSIPPGPLAPLIADTVRKGGVYPLEHAMGVALGLIAPAEAPRPILLPEQEVNNADKTLDWIEATRLKGVVHLLIGHSHAKPQGVVLMVYLTSPSGVLEKAVQRVNGGGFSTVPLADATAGFQKQTAFWLARLAKPDSH